MLTQRASRVAISQAEMGDRMDGRRSSGRVVSEVCNKDNDRAMLPNLTAAPNSSVDDPIKSTIDGWGSIRILRDSLGPHPQFFLRMLADNGDVVVDPVAGSCTTSDAADLLERKLAYCEPRESYLEGGGLQAGSVAR